MLAFFAYHPAWQAYIILVDFEDRFVSTPNPPHFAKRTAQTYAKTSPERHHSLSKLLVKCARDLTKFP